MLVLFARQQLEGGLLVQRLAAERVDQADRAVRVRAQERVRVVGAREQLVDDDALVNEIDPEIAAPQT